jgi:hypothetical protein
VCEVTSWSKDLAVEIAGQDVINHAGAAALRIIADRTGLTAGLSRALARRGFVPVHDRGRVLADTAVLIADGGRVLSDLAMLRDQAELFGSVASDPTLWRALDEIGDTQRRKIARARAKGHHPLEAWCDNTGESLALLLRKGSAGSNTATDHITVLDEAITGIPARYRRNLLITVDGAGASHGLVDHITTLDASPWRTVGYSIGWELAARERTAIARVPESAWGAVLDTDGQPRDLDEAGVVEVTALLREGPGGDQLGTWPADMRIICRREKPHPGAQLSLFETIDGWRSQLLATNTPGKTAQFLEARHRPHARVEDTIRTGKQTGLGHLPSTSININRAWCAAATIACDLLCWLRLLCLDGPLAKAEPKTPRYRLLHTAARIVRGQRKRKTRIPTTWPWAQQLNDCLLTALALPPPTQC